MNTEISELEIRGNEFVISFYKSIDKINVYGKYLFKFLIRENNHLENNLC